MARVNTPSKYKCGSCGTLGHNARACPTKSSGPSATQLLKQQRADKRAAKAAIKAAKAAAKAAPVVVAEPVVDTFVPAVVAHVDALLAEIEEERRIARERDAADLDAAIAATEPIVAEVPVIAEVEPVVSDDGRPVVDIPPAITKFGEQTYVISGSTWVPCPDDTKFEDIAAFVQYIPRKPSGDGISLFRSKRKTR